MTKIDILIQYSPNDRSLDETCSLTLENNRIFNDEIDSLYSKAVTVEKFCALSLTSPIICLIRLVRSVVFLSSKDCLLAKKEFLGALFTPILSVSLLLASTACLIPSVFMNTDYFFIRLRRIWGAFEAWINHISWQAPNFQSYSKRVSDPLDCQYTATENRIWTTAPCMQPLLENGFSIEGGLLDVERMKRVFKKVNIIGIDQENENSLIIQALPN